MSDELKDPFELKIKTILAELGYIAEEMGKLDEKPIADWTDDDREAWSFMVERANDLNAAYQLKRPRHAPVFEVQEDGVLLRIGGEGVTRMYPLRRGGWSTRETGD